MVLKNLSDEMASLGDLLGRAHDLNFLEERLGGEHGRARWQREGRTLLPLIERSENELERAAVHLAERFFAERASDFGKRVEGWMKEWAEAGSESLAEQLV